MKEHDLIDRQQDVFYMVQEMESWFLSQPDILDDFYGQTKGGKKISEKLGKRLAENISSPKEELKQLTSDLMKGERYHEIKHGVALLKRLDATKLEDSFPDFKKLITRLN